MTNPAQSKRDVDASTLVGAAPLDSILCTEELLRRPSRPIDHEKENSALSAMVCALADSPHTILQTLADKILEVLQADSAGLSLLTKDEKRFYWAAISGEWRPHIGGGTPRNFGPCGDVLDRNIPMLFTHWERRYPYLSSATPLATEGLLVPFHVKGRAVGTVWVISHGSGRKFDAEDLRLLESMGRFASGAYQTVQSIEELEVEIAAREKAEAAVREMASGLQAKIRRLVDSNIIGIFIWASDGAIIEANDTFLKIVGYSRRDLVSGSLNWKKLTAAEWRAADDQRVHELEVTGTAQPYEKEYLHRSGGRVPVLVGAAKFEGAADEGVGFVVDLTDRKRAEVAAREIERRYQEVRQELAHANRLATMGQLSASIAHEINQPIGASITYANAASAWLRAQPPDVKEVGVALDLIVESGLRAAKVIDRIRALIKKAPPRIENVKINEAILEVIALAHGEISNKGISLETQLAERLPTLKGDRVQLQQVLLNLLVNAMEAMSGMREGARELLISTAKSNSDQVLVTVQDTGPGLAPEGLDRLFEAFYTTKANGLGMGLSICRSIVEAHQGRLWATANKPQGAVFQFMLPTLHGENGNTRADFRRVKPRP